MTARSLQTIYSGEREINILFTNRALATVESRLGRSVIGVAQGFADGEAGITEVAHLLQVGMEEARRDARESGKSITLDDAYKVMDEVGFAEVASVVMSAVAEVLSFGREEKN